MALDQSGVDEGKGAPAAGGAAPTETEILTVASADASRGELSAATIGRMLGLATVAELRVVESKIDLMASKMNTFAVRIDKALSILNMAPTGKDLERIDVQIAALRTLIREALDRPAAGADSAAESAQESSPEEKKA